MRSSVTMQQGGFRFDHHSDLSGRDIRTRRYRLGIRIQLFPDAEPDPRGAGSQSRGTGGRSGRGRIFERHGSRDGADEHFRVLRAHHLRGRPLRRHAAAVPPQRGLGGTAVRLHGHDRPGKRAEERTRRRSTWKRRAIRPCRSRTSRLWRKSRIRWGPC